MESINPIYNLRDLTVALERLESRNCEQLLSKIRFNYKDIEHLCFWDADHYSRINIGSGKNYSVDLICWEKDQHSPIHNHSDDHAWTYVLKGQITEKLYTPINGEKFNFKEEVVLPQKNSSNLNSGEVYHELVNSFNGRSVSLHLYVS